MRPWDRWVAFLSGSESAPDSPSTDGLDSARIFAAKGRDLEALRSAVVDAATVSGPLWITYLLALFYVLVAAGAVTHLDLLLERPVKLPFLGIEMPLTGFFWFAPIAFVVLHTYVLLHFMILVSKVRAFDAELRRQITDLEQRRWLRGQLPTNLFVHLLAGPRETGREVVPFLLWAMGAISLVVGPVLLLLFLLLKFLPYHSEIITWTQRIVVLTDIAVIWTLWPRLGWAEAAEPLPAQAHPSWRCRLQVWRSRAGKQLGRLSVWVFGQPPIGQWPDFRWSVPRAAAALVVGLGFLIATFPGEALDDWIGRNDWWMPGLRPLRTTLIAGVPDPASQRPRSLFSNVLVLPGIRVTEDPRFDTPAKLDAASRTFVLRNRDLRGAVLDGADLRKAELDFVKLQGASLMEARLQNASLNHAKLQGIFMDSVRLEGASLRSAELQGASLANAQLQGAILDEANLDAAKLDGASWQGASLTSTSLLAASISDGFLEGASFRFAQLQGANLDPATLDEAMLFATFVWHTRFSGFGLPWIILPISDQFWKPPPTFGPKFFGFKEYKKFTMSLESSVPAGPLQHDALVRAKWLEPATDPDTLARDEETAENWDGRSKQSDPAAVLRLQRLGCGATHAPFIMRGLYSNFIVFRGSPLSADEKRSLAAAFVAKDCEGAHGLDEETRAALLMIAAETAEHAATPERSTGP